ncbi:MAG: (deoxy)nucleoside triphosphate pyrophosphohydrolase [Candidatus Binatia bacterium]
MSIPSDPTHVSAAILVRNGRVLACQRRDDQTHPGGWEFPGGKRELGETMAECLRRELREELGIEATIGREVWRTEHHYPGGSVALVFFHVSGFAGEIRNLVFADLRWVTVEELAGLDVLEADRGLVERLRGGLMAELVG